MRAIMPSMCSVALGSIVGGWLPSRSYARLNASNAAAATSIGR